MPPGGPAAQERRSGGPGPAPGVREVRGILGHQLHAHDVRGGALAHARQLARQREVQAACENPTKDLRSEKMFEIRKQL